MIPKIRPKYISLKEAAEISGYSADYLGWLIRKGKIKGKKVYLNTSWRVPLSQLVRYCQKRNKDFKVFPAFHLKRKYLSLKEAAQLSGYSPDYIGYLIRKGEIKGKKVYSNLTWIVEEKLFLNYLKEAGKLSSTEILKKKRNKLIKKLNLIYDIFPPHLIKKVAQEVSGWKPYESLEEKIFNLSWRLSLLVFIVFLLIGFGPANLFSKIAKAFIIEEEKTVNFYPQECQGGWENFQEAQGKPDLFTELDFNEENSAILRKNISPIICGNFEGETFENVRIKKVSLKFSWLFKKEERIQIPFFSPSEDSKEETSLPKVIPNQEEISPPQETNQEKDLPVPNPENNRESLPPSSFWQKFINSVFAQGDSEEKLEGDNSSNSSERKEDNLSKNLAEGFLEIFYTLDQENWQSLGKVNENNYKDLVFELPISDWSSLKDLKIKIEGSMVFDEQPIVYLDGMWLEVSYEKLSKEELIDSLPRIDLKEEEIFKPSKRGFRADEEPAFEIDLAKFKELRDKIKKIEEEKTREENFSETEPPPLEEKENPLPGSSLESQKNFQTNLSLLGEGNSDLKTKESFSKEIEEESKESRENNFLEDKPPNPENEKINSNLKVKEENLSPQTREEEKENISREQKNQEKVKEESLLGKIIDFVKDIFQPEEEKVEIKKAEVIGPFLPQVRIKEEKKTKEKEEELGVQLVKPEKNFRPGKFEIKVELLAEDKVFVARKEFTWGVLAINLDKSIYLPGEVSFLQMAALDNEGHTLCRAKLRLEIINPLSEIETLETEKGTIQYSPSCGPDNVTDNPDYFAYYQVKEPGSYKIKLTNLDNGYEIEDSFEVREKVPFEIERRGATRINPFLASYLMTIKIKAKDDFQGEITESVPDSFEVKAEGARIETTKNLKLIVWKVNLKGGEEIELKYEYQAPKVSPQLHLLGPLKIKKEKGIVEEIKEGVKKIIEKIGEGVLDLLSEKTKENNYSLNEEEKKEDFSEFQELRYWQIASDQAGAGAGYYQFSPTSGNLVLGDEQTITSATASSNEGVNVGSWRGTLADDDFHWVVASTASGVDMQLNLDGVQLNGANKMIIQTEVDLDATAPNLLFQICDWVSSTNVDNAADTQCTGGGWRTLNTKNASQAAVAFTGTTAAALQFHIYDGYWSTGTTGGTPISTPLSNFVRSSDGRVKIRYFSTTNTTSQVAVDFLRILVVVDSVYHPASFTQISGGTPSGHYGSTIVVGNTATGQQSTTGGDALYLSVPGTSTQVSDFYFSFKNVKTYTGMNTIYVKADYSCSGTGPTHRPKIWNFSTSAWEDLTTASIACSTTDATQAWAKNNVDITNYIQNGEIRIGWRALSASTVSLRIDFIYIIVGTTNTDSSQCEVSFGTGVATDCTNTRDLDSTGTTNNWVNPTEDESTTFSHTYYPFDTDMDATVEEAAASNLSFPVTPPSNAAVVGAHFAGRFTAGTGLTVQLGLRDYSAFNQALGGWTAIGGTAAATTTITDSITDLTISAYGLLANPEDHLDTYNNQMNLRLRTTSAGATTNNASVSWDFAMVSLMWIEVPDKPIKTYQFSPTSGNLVLGTEQTITSATAASSEGVNVGSWRGTLADDNFHWVVASTASGIDMQLNLDGVQLNGVNKMIIQTEVDLDATAPNLLFQICDWVSSTNVDNAADTQCTGGGWRTLNTKNASQAAVAFTGTAAAALQFHIYDGYWSTGTTGGTPISTPLSNFVRSSDGRVKIRYFSTTNTTSQVAVDFLRILVVVDSVYHPASFTQISGGTPSGHYGSTIVVGNTATGQQSTTGGDAIRLLVPGTASQVSDFYFSFKNVKTYTGMNTIYVKADYSCSGTGGGLTHRPKIWNFSTSAWEDLTTASIACSTTDATQAWAKNNVDITNYIQNGEIRIGWRALSASTVSLRIDFIYIIVGTTNTDSSQCEVSFGTGVATDCTNTRDLDSTGTTNNWVNPTEDESTTFSHTYYPFDTDMDATVEEAAASNLSFPVTPPSNAAVVGAHFAGRFTAGTGLTVQLGLRDYSAFNQTVGGWTAIGGTAAATTTITDSITDLTISAYGLLSNPEDHLDTYNNQMNLRLRTISAGATTNNASVSWDFGLVSLMWVEIVSSITISGTVYQTDESTALTSQPAMKLAVGDSTAYTTTANADGTFSFTNVTPPSVGTVLTIWLDTNAGSDKASLVFKYGSSCNGYPNCTGLSLYQNRVNIDNKDTGNITNSDLEACDNDSGTACSDTDIGFTSNAGALTLTLATNMLRITSGVTFAPGGNVTAQKLRVAGTYSGGSETLTLSGTGSGTTCGAAAQMPLCVDGTFNASSNTTKFTGDADLTIAVQTYNNLLLAPSLVASVTYTFASAPSLTISGDFTINPNASSALSLTVNMGASIIVANTKTTTITRTGSATSELNTTASNYSLSTGRLNIGSGGTLRANLSTITLTGTSGTLFTNNGTFNAGGSTVVMNPNASVTLTSGTITFNNLTLSPTLTASRTYTFGSGALTINGDFTINPNAFSALSLTVNMGASITVANTKTTTITRTGSATSELNTTASNYSLSTGRLNIGSGGTLRANLSTITLTGTSGTLFTNNGTFNAGGSTVVMNPNASVTLTSGTITFNNLTLSPTLTASRTYTFGSGALTINGDFTINPNASSALSLTVNMGASITVANTKTTTITRTGSATSELNTTTSNRSLSTGRLTIESGGTLTANLSTITLTGTSGTLFTNNGTFNAGGSTVVMNPDASVTLTSGTITFNNLTLSPKITASRTYTFGSGDLTVNGDLEITPSLKGFQAINSIIYDGTNYVAAGYDTSADSSGDAVIWESTNRTSWTKRVVDGTAGSYQAINSIIYDGTNYVAAGEDYSADSSGDAVIWESTNRTSWTKRVVDGTAGSDQLIYSIIYDGTNYVAAGIDDSAGSYDAVIWESTNRTSWTKRVVDGTAGSYQAIYSIIYDGTNYVAAGIDNSAGSYDAVIWESTNRTSWTKRVVDGTAGSYQAIYSIIYDGTNYVAAGEDYSADSSGDAVIWESTNRTSWTKRVVDDTAGSNQAITSIIYDGTNYVAAGYDNSAGSYDAVIWESTNRTSWTKRVVDGTAGSSQYINSIIYDGTNYVAAGVDYSADSNGDAVIWESTNRTSWRGQPLGDTSLVLTLNLGGNIAVASGKTTTIGYGSVSLVVDTMPVATPYNLSTGNLTIKPFATLDSTGATSAINVAGNYTNNGTFTAGFSTVTLNGTSTQTLSGTMTGSSAFYNLTITNNSGASATDCERTGFTASVDFNSAATVTNDYTINTANVRIEYNSGSTYTFNNIKWNGQAAGTRIYFRNSLTSGTWLLNVSGTQAVSYVNVSRSDASPGDTIDATDGTSVDCGNNTNWNFFTPTISYSISANSLFLGNLNPTAVFSNSHDVTVSTNAPSGYVLYVYEDGNLRQEIGEFVFDIDDVTDGSVTAGSEEYGLNTGFDDFVSDSAITSTMKIARQSSSAVSNQTTTCTYKVAVSNSTVAGFYSHIVTYIVTGRF